MLLVKPSYTIESPDLSSQLTRDEILCNLERYARTCYKSEDKITTGSARKLIRTLVKSGHHSQLEHVSITVKFIVDRGVTHELVRHRLCAYSQESTRYCNYKGGVTFIIPPWVPIEPGNYYSQTDAGALLLDYACHQWYDAMLNAEAWYKHLLEAGWSPQQARSVLPNSLKTEIVTTANLREWRHIFALRTNKKAHPQMVEIMKPLHGELVEMLPEIFGEES